MASHKEWEGGPGASAPDACPSPPLAHQLVNITIAFICEHPLHQVVSYRNALSCRFSHNLSKCIPLHEHNFCIHVHTHTHTHTHIHTHTHTSGTHCHTCTLIRVYTFVDPTSQLKFTLKVVWSWNHIHNIYTILITLTIMHLNITTCISSAGLKERS